MNKNKKIKSVKLAKDYRTSDTEIKAGTELFLEDENYFVNDTEGRVSFFHINKIINSQTGLFEIEYQDEHFEYRGKLYSADKNFIDAVANARSLRNKNFLNALADWCDKKFITNELLEQKHINRCVISYHNYLEVLNFNYINDDCYPGNLILNSNRSARLFISELNRDENKEVKEYLINLLKSKRLI